MLNIGPDRSKTLFAAKSMKRAAVLIEGLAVSWRIKSFEIEFKNGNSLMDVSILFVYFY